MIVTARVKHKIKDEKSMVGLPFYDNGKQVGTIASATKNWVYIKVTDSKYKKKLKDQFGKASAINLVFDPASVKE